MKGTLTVLFLMALLGPPPTVKPVLAAPVVVQQKASAVLMGVVEV